MTRMRKSWIIAAAVLVILGIIAFTVVMCLNKWDFTKLSTAEFETNRHEINEDFCNLSFEIDTTDIILAPSADEKCRVECYEDTNAKHSVTVDGDILVIKVNDEKAWYEKIGINLHSAKITLYLPKTEYFALSVKGYTGDVTVPNNFKFENVDIALVTGDVNYLASASNQVKINTTTGKITVENTTVSSLALSATTGRIAVSNVNCSEDLSLSVSTGKTYLTDINCKNLTSRGSTGDISLCRVIAAEKLIVERSTGDVSFDGADAAELFVTTDTGDVTGALLSEKVFVIQTDTGKTEVPKTSCGGRCEITTDTGDINISIK